MAELMDRAESATSDGERETARADATELVLRIWKHRSSWPNGWPPKASAAVLSMGDQSPHARREPTGSRWLDSLDSLERLQSRERKIWKDLGLLDFDVESERRAAEALSAEGDEEELSAIQAVIRLLDSAQDEMRQSLEDPNAIQSPSARARVGLAKLKDVDGQRYELREKIMSQGVLAGPAAVAVEPEDVVE